jgi:glycosyltransferase involved in cell wall biosynthesis
VIALVTNYLPPYRIPLYRLLAERLGVEVFCFGGEGRYVPAALRDLDGQIAQAPFPAHRLRRQSDAARLARDSDAVIASVAGRVALPASYAGARRAGCPFILWTSLWRHPRTPTHLASLPLMRHLYRQAGAVLTYGAHVSRYVERYRGRGDDVFVAAQAVEPELFARPVTEAEIDAWRDAARVADGPLVLYAGRLAPEKGVDVLLRAWPRVGQPTGATLCLAGDGALDATASGGDRVRLLGRVPREQLAVAYAAASFLVVPSLATARFLEPWGLVCNEAMSQARPVVATPAVGAAAGGLVRDGETGLVVRERDEEALAGAIARLLEDAQLRERLGATARDAVSELTYERAATAFATAVAVARDR